MPQRKNAWTKKGKKITRLREITRNDNINKSKMWKCERVVATHWGNCTADPEYDLSQFMQRRQQKHLLPIDPRNIFFCCRWNRRIAAPSARSNVMHFKWGETRQNRKNCNRTHSIEYSIVWETMPMHPNVATSEWYHSLTRVFSNYLYYYYSFYSFILYSIGIYHFNLFSIWMQNRVSSPRFHWFNNQYQ